MTTLTTTNNPGSQPLERKKAPAPVLDTPENSIEEKRVGWFDQSEFQEYKIETSGMSGVGSISFDTDKVVQPSIISEMFDGSNKWISIKPSNVAEKAVNIASTAINVTKDLASASIDAGSDLIFNQMLGKAEKQSETPQDPSKLDPTVAKKQEEAQEYSANEQQKGDIEAEILNIRRKLENMTQLAPRKQEIADLTGLQAMLSGKSSLVNESGEVRKDLEAPIAQKRREILEAQQARENPITSASKQGGQGMETKKVNLANETSGGNTNATNAVG